MEKKFTGSFVVIATLLLATGMCKFLFCFVTRNCFCVCEFDFDQPACSIDCDGCMRVSSAQKA